MSFHEQEAATPAIAGLEVPYGRQSGQIQEQGFGLWRIGVAERRVPLHGRQRQKEKPQFRPQRVGLQRTLRLQIQVLPLRQQNRLFQPQKGSPQNHHPIVLWPLPHLSPAHSLLPRWRLQKGKKFRVLFALYGLWWASGEGQQEIQQRQILWSFGLLWESYVVV